MANDGFNLFGFQIKKAKPEQNWSVVPPISDDGATIGTSGAGYYGLVLDLEATVKNENDLIRRYRETANYSDCDTAIEDIVNEALVADSNKVTVSIDLDDLQAPDKIKDIIRAEFDTILRLLDFEEKGHDVFRQWYVDGRLFYNIILDQNPKNGIAELRFIDPRKIRKIKDVKKEKDPQTGADVVVQVDEYYVFNDRGMTEQTSNGIKISPDAIIYGNSGLIDFNTGMVLSYLHKVIKPTNQLKVMEDALVIYRLARAPERRIFYIDVGNLPKLKAEQYIQDMMNKYRNKIVVDSQTGEIKDQKQHLCLSMDTRVPLLDGRTLTLEEIAQEYQHKRLWAYSCDPVTGNFQPGLITWAGVSRPNAQVMRLTLDNGETITCTPDHKFPVWGKNLVQAKDLVVGDSMIPHYRRTHQLTGGKFKDYEQIFENESKEWKFTHRLVSQWKDYHGIDNELVFNEQYLRDGFDTVYPCDINHIDNSPDRIDVRFADANTYGNLKEQYQYRTHKVAKIEYLEERMDTGCLTIDGDEIYHNYHTFALAAGVYTQNSMQEDYWIPRRGDGKATEITTLPGAQLGEIGDITYFQTKLYQALNVPVSRLQPQQGFSLGRSTEITREEIKFNKFIERLRRKFASIFRDALRVQLITKGVIRPEEWSMIAQFIHFDYQKDNHFAELKNAEILAQRINMLQLIDPFIGRYYSIQWVRENVLMQTDDEIETINKQIEQELPLLQQQAQAGEPQ